MTTATKLEGCGNPTVSPVEGSLPLAVGLGVFGDQPNGITCPQP
jgi:hypothetical protein